MLNIVLVMREESTVVRLLHTLKSVVDYTDRPPFWTCLIPILKVLYYCTFRYFLGWCQNQNGIPYNSFCFFFFLQTSQLGVPTCAVQTTEVFGSVDMSMAALPNMTATMAISWWESVSVNAGMDSGFTMLQSVCVYTRSPITEHGDLNTSKETRSFNSSSSSSS